MYVCAGFMSGCRIMKGEGCLTILCYTMTLEVTWIRKVLEVL